MQSYEIFSANGMKVRTALLSGTKATVNTQTFSEGVYYLNIYTSKGKSTTKLIK